MDPKAVLECAFDTDKSMEERQEACEAYRRWIAKGGFEARWQGRTVEDVWVTKSGEAFVGFTD